MHKQANSNNQSFLQALTLLIISLFIASSLTSCGGAAGRQGSTTRQISSNNNTQHSTSTRKTSYKGSGNAYVSRKALDKKYLKIAVLPFKAELEIAGASVADMVTTEILKTYKYELIERSQIEQILQEQSLGMQGVTESSMAMQVGKILGVQGVIVGTVPEFGVRSVNGRDLPAVGINIRMIDTETGSIIWTVSDSAISKDAISISTFADQLVESMIEQLRHEWIANGDTFAVNLPSPQIVHYEGFIRKAKIQVHPESIKKVQSYTLLRSRTNNGPYTKIQTIKNSSAKTITFEDSNLLDAETYYYKIAGSHLSGLNGIPAGPVKVTTKGAPNSLTQLRAEDGGLRECKITWTPSTASEVVGYDIFRGESETGLFNKIAHIKKRESSQYLDKNGGSNKRYGKLKDDFTYFYRLRAVNTVGVQSPDSPTISSKTEGIPPIVNNLRADQNMLRKVALTWTPSTDKYVKGYEILRSTSENGTYSPVTFIKGRDKTEFIDKGQGSSWGKAGSLADNTTYYYKIKSINYVDVKSKDSNMSNSITRGKPPVVKGLLAESDLPRKVHLLWQPSSDEFVDGYTIYRSISESGPYEEIKHISGRDKSEFNDTGTGSSWGKVGKLKDNKTYYYQIKSVNIVDVKSLNSESASATTKPMLDKISDLTALSNQVKQVTIRWSSSDAKEYEIYRGDRSTDITKKVKTVGAKTSEYIDKKLKDGQQYYYKVRAIDSFDLPGAFSDPAVATTKPLPNKPTNLMHSMNGDQVYLTWDKNSEDDIANYKIFTKGVFSWQVVGDSTTNSFTPKIQLKKEKEILFRVIAVDNTGLESQPSSEIKVSLPK